MLMKILINHPDFALLGGVSNHYEGLREHWTQNVIYNTIGGRKKFNCLKFLWLFWDVIKFVFKMMVYRPDVVLLNPSLGATALRRDFLFLTIARLFGVPVAVFIHGFSLEYLEKIDPIWLSKWLNKASLIFVLASFFKHKLEKIGIRTPIVLTTTKVDDTLLEGANIEKCDRSAINHLLFVARIHKTKGIYETIDAFDLLAEQHPFLELTIAGNGPDFSELKARVNQSAFSSRIHVLGDLRGDALQKVYARADLYILPTTHAEGMPTSVLEAMAFGLPVFTRKVGGLVDFFNENMGYITDSVDPKDFALAIEPYLNDIDLYRSVSEYNRQYAQAHFMASRVALDIEDKIEKHILTNKR